YGAVLALEEEGRAYVVGRGNGCDLMLADADASREHMRIVRRAALVLVRDLESKNAVLLGDALVPADRDVAWRNGTMLRIGSTVLTLEEPVALALGELEQLADEPVAEEDVPAPTPSEATEAIASASAGARGGDVVRRPRAPKEKGPRVWSATDLAV